MKKYTKIGSIAMAVLACLSLGSTALATDADRVGHEVEGDRQVHFIEEERVAYSYDRLALEAYTSQMFATEFDESVRTVNSVEVVAFYLSDDTMVLDENGRSKYVTALGETADGQYVNLSLMAEWEETDPNVATAYGGLVHANGKGVTTISVSYGNYVATMSVTVLNEIDWEAQMEAAYDKYEAPYVDERSPHAVDAETARTRAKAMNALTWTPKKQDLRGWGTYFYKNQQVKGIPYSQNVQKYENDFLSVVDNSSFYNSSTSGSGHKQPYYGNDCSAYLSRCWQISRKTTYDFKSGIGSTYKKVGSYGSSPTTADLTKAYASLKRGDGLVKRANSSGHARLVMSVDTAAKTVYCYEQTPPKAKTATYTFSELAGDKYWPFTK